ncbi:MAG: AI-2E family transporter [Alphaproteobacteria bacterium]|nr:AI-2E family transporter [Alphaproteobacteria bacterium]
MKQNYPQGAWFVAFAIVATSILYSLGSMLMPFFAGFVGAYALNFPVSWLSEKRFSRGITSAFFVVSLIILLITLMLIAFPYLQQHLFLLASSIPPLIERLFQNIAPTLERISQDYGTPSAAELKTQVISHLGDILTWSVRVITNLLSNGMALANLLSLVILTPIITFYLLKDWPRLIAKIDSLLPSKWAPTIRTHAKTIDRTLASYVKGQAIICLILMALYSFGLWAVGLKQGVVVGVLTGFMSFIPYIGMLIGYMTSLGISFTEFTGWSSIGLITLVFVIISLIEGNILIPRFIGQKIGLHPVWIIFSLLAAGTWFGFMGILFALPVIAALGVITRIVLDWYVKSPSPQLKGAQKRQIGRAKGVK